MIPLPKLLRLHPKPRLRKAALLLTEAERSLRGPEPAAAAKALEYARSLAAALLAARDLGEALPSGDPHLVELLAAAGRLAGEPGPAPAGTESGGGPEAALRAIDRLRHALLAASGQALADWDLLDPASGRPDAAARRVHPGMEAYLEDLRSPFNVGSAFRTADAFGLERIILSPACADPAHPRAERSAMGATRLVPWARAGLEALDGLPAFALELGGIPLEDFAFPDRGVVVLGSEELGVSPEALARCSLGKVSIPMAGVKGSLNAGVAFGVLLQAWDASLRRRGLAPGLA